MGSYIRGAYIRGAYIWRAFCVSICISKTLKSIIISINHRHDRQKRFIFMLKSPLFCFRTYLEASQYLMYIMTIDISTCFVKIQDQTWNSALALFLGRLIFDKTFVLVSREFICRGGLIFEILRYLSSKEETKIWLKKYRKI